MLEPYYIRSAGYSGSVVERIESSIGIEGPNALSRGFIVDTEPGRLQESLARLKDATQPMKPGVSAEVGRALDDFVARLDSEHPPTLSMFAQLVPGQPAIGAKLLVDADVNIVKYPGRDCVHVVAAELSKLFPGRDFPLEVEASHKGAPAVDVFVAANSAADFTTPIQVQTDMLKSSVPVGEVCQLAWTWAGGRAQGAHMGLVRKKSHDENEHFDPLRRKWEPGWPEQWAPEKVDRMAGGRLDPTGSARKPLAANAARVQNQESTIDPTSRTERSDYRAQDPTTRQLDLRYADALLDVIGIDDAEQVTHLAQDLFGAVRGTIRQAEPIRTTAQGFGQAGRGNIPARQDPCSTAGKLAGLS